jgi:nicotinamidase-related amidase
MRYSLIVVDMQPFFPSSRSTRVKDHCRKEIQKAMDAGAPIIFVEYLGCGPTNPNLVKMTDYYDKTFLVRKRSDNGSSEISKLLSSYRLPARHLRVCGVNTNACVESTVYGLSRKCAIGAKIEVVAKACNAGYNGHQQGLDKMSTYRNVKVV